MLHKLVRLHLKSMMKLKSWIVACRFRTLPLSLSCVLMGAILSSFFKSIDHRILLLTISTTILLQILSNLANDYGDGIKGTDINRQGPDRMLQKGYLSLREMLVLGGPGLAGQDLN